MSIEQIEQNFYRLKRESKRWSSAAWLVIASGFLLFYEEPLTSTKSVIFLAIGLLLSRTTVSYVSYQIKRSIWRFIPFSRLSLNIGKKFIKKIPFSEKIVNAVNIASYSLLLVDITVVYFFCQYSFNLLYT